MEYLDLKSQYNAIKEEIDPAIKRVLEAGVFVGGQEFEEFEKEMAQFCGSKYALGVNSGTDALFLSLKALGLKPGDEVITSPFTFIATAEVVVNSGTKPVFADICPSTFNINPEELEKRITEKTKAIIPVHLFGQLAQMDRIIETAKKHNLYVIEDAAQAIGAEYRKRKAGTFGNSGCFSFFPSKNLGAYGDGGMIITNDQKLAEKIALLKNHGSSSKEKYLNLDIGTNSRLDSIQAAVLRVKLKHLSFWNAQRKQLADYYNTNLSSLRKIKVPSLTSDSVHVFNQYTIRAKNRDRLKNYLREKGIATMIYYPLPLHLQPCFQYLGYNKGDFPEAEKAAEEVLSLPLYPELKKQDQDFIIEKIKAFYEKQN